MACRALMGVDPLELAAAEGSLGGQAGESVAGSVASSNGGDGGARASSGGDGGAHSSSGGGDGGAGESAGGQASDGGSAAVAGAGGDGGSAPVSVDVPHHLSISTDGLWMCAVHSGGLYCWERAFADPTLLARADGAPGNPLTPGPVAGRSGTFTASQISAGREHNCALQAGRVFCWGDTLWGRLGGSGGPLGVPVQGDADFTNVVEISAGRYFTCSRTADLALFCWGDHAGDVAFGQLTSDFEAARVDKTSQAWSFRARAFRIDSLQGATHVAVGEDHGCASLGDGSPVCWGRNDYLQTGQTKSDVCSKYNDANTKNPCVRHVTRVAGLGPVRQFALSRKHSCALEVSGSVRCWGANGSYQLGGDASSSASCTGVELTDGAATPETCSAVPLEVPEAFGADFIAARADTSCAVKQGEVWCWGDNPDNVLGRENGGAAPARVKLASGGLLEGVVEIALGQNIGCALTGDEQLFCWGRSPQTNDVLPGAVLVPW